VIEGGCALALLMSNDGLRSLRRPCPVQAVSTSSYSTVSESLSVNHCIIGRRFSSGAVVKAKGRNKKKRKDLDVEVCFSQFSHACFMFASDFYCSATLRFIIRAMGYRSLTSQHIQCIIVHLLTISCTMRH